MSHNKIIVAIGGNLHSKNGLHPVEICQEAIKSLKSMSIIVEKQSSWYRSDPIPKSDQPKFFNSVLVASTTLNELDVLNSLHDIEKKFGKKVAQIIDGLTKIQDVFDKNVSLQAENFKKMLLTLSDDVRVILIKLADRFSLASWLRMVCTITTAESIEPNSWSVLSFNGAS